MPKKISKETAKEQSERFKREVKRLIDAGELSPTEAAAALDTLVKKTAEKPG
jgi:polyhydroxyalkanoate synthesis regulator phasin